MTFKAKTISELDLLTSIASGDLVPIVDVSDTAAGTTKKTTITDLINTVVASANFTTQGNTFNGASQLVQLNASTQLPAVSGVNLTNLNASNVASGTLSDARLSTNVTVQGNTFNGANQLVQLNASTQLPALSGVNLTNLNASNIASGTLNDARLSSNVEIKTKTVNQVATAISRPLGQGDVDNILMFTHSSGIASVLCTNDPQFLPGQKVTVICNTVNSVAIAADTSVTIYYLNSLGAASTIAPSAAYTPSAQRGRVFNIYCVASNTYFIEGVSL